MSRSLPGTGDAGSDMDSGILVDTFRAALAADPQSCTYRFLADGEGDETTITNVDLDRRARSIAATLRQRLPEGERALIVCPPGLDYLAAFLGCLYARIVAVPVYPPNPVLLKRTLPRLLAVIQDAQPAVVLAPAAIAAMAEQIAEHAPILRSLSWLPVDDIDPDAADGWRRPGFDPADIAFLQYTSGSTGSPKGVVLSHANLLANLVRINRRFVGGATDTRAVSWLPPYHDMGLIGSMLQPLYGRLPVTFMSPVAFLKRPVRWLRAISRFGATHSGGPNFAYDLCVAKIPEDERRDLDLSRWRLAFSGAEPVRKDTIDRFVEAFGPAGFRRSAFFPCYGLAEATLFVTGGAREVEPSTRRLSASALAQHRVVDAADGEDARTVVGCGDPVDGHVVAIVDPDSGRRLEPGRVGEIWVAGPSVAQGYWRRPAESAEVFGAVVTGTGEGPFLRTGDLGFLDGDELYVTGRRKDLIIVAGDNHYPHDLERTAEQSHPAVRPGGCAAFAVDEDGEDRVVIVAEVAGNRSLLDPDQVFGAVRAAVADQHGLVVHDVVLIKPGGIPKTSSGKLQRGACRQLFREDALDRVAGWRADAGEPGAAKPDAGGAAKPDAGAAAEHDGNGAGAAGRLGADRRTQLERWLLQHLASLLGQAPDRLDPTEPMAGYGLSSVQAVGLVGDLEQELGRKLPGTLVWEYPTVEALAGYLCSLIDGQPAAAGGPADGAAAPAGSAGPVAVIGIGCRFPGGADGPDGFWRLLCEGRDAVTEVPPERWDVEAVHDADPAAPGKTTTRWGGFLTGVDGFDAHFFGISAHEATRIDPQQRLLAEVTWAALEDAGVVPGELAGSATGVFVGISTNDYGHRTAEDLTRIDAYTGTGNALSIAANRLSYQFDLRGPSVALDTACSSSLVAVHQACLSLAQGDCSMAIAGGVNLVLSPALAINFSKAGAMASDGRCKAFDARADGYVRSEGAGVVVLKPLSRAVADGDPIYGVIRGSAVNQDGRTNGLMAPNPHAQEAVLRAAYARAGVSPAQVRYVETHGTGTLLGDPIEARALAAVVSAGRDPAEPCVIGSVKSNIGHLEAAAGIAGLIKTALVLRHRSIPANLHFDRPNPHIPFDELALRVADVQQPWPDGAPALAGVSSFGFGGTNAHVVLSGPPEPTGNQAGTDDRPQLLTVSARDETALRELADRYRDRLAEPRADADLAGICLTAAVRRTHHEHRLACVGSTAAELQDALTAFLAGEQRPGLSWSHRRLARRPQVTFVFSGQGPRWWPLAGDLLDLAPVRESLERSDAALRSYVDWSLLDQLTGRAEPALLDDPAVAQPALCAVQIALAGLWRSWGVEPAAVVGHSVGEVAAAHVAGALSRSDALRVAWHRGRVIRAALGRGTMAVVGVPLPQAEQILAERRPGAVSVAASNGPATTVLSGDTAALQALAEALERDGVFCRILESVRFASHSEQMTPLQAELTSCLTGLATRPTTVPMISTGTAAPIDGTALDAGYWGRNLRRPVLFDPAVTTLIEAGHDTFVEIAPHPMLGQSVAERMAAQQSDGVVVASLRRDEPGRTTVLGELGRLYSAGFPVDWRAIHGPAGPVAALPPYPWQRRRHWIDDEYGRPRRTGGAGHPLLETSVRSAVEPGAHHFTARVDLHGFPYLRDHRVAGATVLPASVLLDASLAAARRVGQRADVVVEDLRLTRLTVVDDEAEEDTVQLVLTPQTAEAGAVAVFSRRAGDTGAWTEVARGRFRAAPPDDHPTGSLTDVRDRCPEPVDTAEHYARLDRAGLQYGAAFQAVDRLWRGRGEAVARLGAAPPAGGGYLVHPAVLDGCLQVLAAALGAADGDTYLPVGVDRFELGAGSGTPRWAHAVVGAAGPDDITGCTVTLFDDDGNRLGAVEGITLHRLDRPGAADPVADSLLEVGWRELPDDAGPPVLRPGWWLVLADRGGVGDELRAALHDRGADCVTVAVGDGYRQVGDRRYEADPARPGDLAALLGDLRAGHPAPCAGVVHAWSLDAAVRDDMPDPLDRAQDLAAVSVLHLVQALVPAGGPAPARLVLVTRGAQTVGAETGPAAVGQAALWGLGRVVALEHGELGPTLVDLDPASDRPGAELLDELTRDGPGEVARRGGRRYAPRLTDWTPPPGPDPAPPRPFDAGRDGNYRILATSPGILNSLAPVRWQRERPGSGQVQIEVTAAGLNFSDVLKAMEICPGVPPGIVPLGAECAGRVVAVGGDVTGHRVGDRVMAVAPSSMAAFATTPAALVAPVPDGLDDAQAAAVPIAFLTAVYGLEYLAHLGAGDTVLIHSATGGVGLAALQVARRNGAQVYATAGTERKRELLRSLGVAHVMDSRSLRFADEVRELTGGRGVDVVLNSLAGEALTRSLSVLAPNGRFVEIGKQDVYRNSHVGLEALKHNRSFFAVDLERSFAEQPALIARLLAEVGRGFRTGEFQPLPVTTFRYDQAAAAFGQMAQARHTGKVVLRPAGNERIVQPPDGAPVRPGATYLITGGAGALGLHTARYLVERGARHLLLLGRTEPSPQVRTVLDELRSHGAEVRFRPADLSRSGSVTAALAEAGESMPPLAGVVHAAGILDDGLLVHLDRDRFRSVGAAKAVGAWHLHRATLGHDLDFFVLYSSAAALLGSPGQGNYAAANAVLDALARHRRAGGRPALSIAWGPWAEAGLAARPDRGGQLSARGVLSLAPADGIAALDRLLRTPATQACVLPLDRRRLRDAADSGLVPAVLTDLLEVTGTPGARPRSGAVRERLLSVEPGRRRRAMLLQHCAGELAQVLRVDADRVDPSAPLAAMGLDSLMALELRKRLESTLGIDLPATVAWRFPTLEVLAPFLAEQMDVALEAEPATTTAITTEAPATEDADLEGLSDDDLEVLLLAKITQFDEGRQG